MSHKNKLNSTALLVIPALFLFTACGNGGGGEEDAIPDHEAEPDTADADARPEERPDEGPTDPQHDEAALEDPDTADAVLDDGGAEDTAEEEVPAAVVDCGGTACSETQDCCLSAGPPALSCVPRGSCEWGLVQCDEVADCPGEECCLNPIDNDVVKCASPCDLYIVCTSNTDCPIDQPSCCPFTLYAGLFSTCSNVPCS